MLYFSVFPMAFRVGTQNCTFRFHNLSYIKLLSVYPKQFI